MWPNSRKPSPKSARAASAVKSKPAASLGFTLTEVLVAVLVLAFGVLGAAGLQLAALRTNQQSSQLAFATALGSEMAERIRANGAARSIYTSIDYSPGAPIAAPQANCYTDSCTALQVADFDRAEWLRRVQDMLPRGRARVCQDSAPHNGSRLVWTCDGKGGIVVKLGWQGRAADGSLERDGADAANVGQPRLVLAL